MISTEGIETDSPHAFVIKGWSHLTLVNCKVHSSKRIGVQVLGGRCVMKDCEVTASRGKAVGVRRAFVKSLHA